MSRPRIGVNCDVTQDPSAEEKLTLNWSYADAVLRGGGQPLLLPPVGDDAAVAEQLDTVDGLLLTGGRDYDPALYGRLPHPATKLLAPRRMGYDVALARGALARGLPVLGICGGAQLVNIACGGTLLQDIPSEVPEPLTHTRGSEAPTFHPVEVLADSRLASIVGAGELETNSSHHQAMDAVGRGLTAVAWASDGVAEAVEGTSGPFVLAVQWHPERLLDRAPHAALFGALVAAAAR